MNKIVRKEQFSEKVFLFEIEAPLIAKSRKAGNFVIVRVGKKGERMPLTIAGADIEKGTITLVVQMVGLSSKKLCALNEGDYVTDVVGPLGNPTKIEKYGTVVCAGGGLGVAPMLPIIQALKAAGNRVLSVMAGRSKWRGSDAADHPGAEGRWQPCAVCDGWSLEGSDYPGGQGSREF